jgi:integrase
MPQASMTADEVRRVLDTAAGFDAAAALALRIAAVAGARRAELAALRWSDVAGDRLTIDSAIETERHGRRGDPMAPTLTDAPTKTANRRVVVLDADTVETIEALMREGQHLGQWMLSDTDEPVNPDRIGAWWRRARKAAGIDPAWRLHDLRHWSATVAITSGHDVRTVAGRLGHANPAMTLRVYAHAVEAADEALAKTLGRILEPSEE